ncbi:ParB/RepB/Spo0J family partition protein [Streptomyces sp. ISL-87]|uniref:ParB/RepB/Spo0J family partition protein n=1 Tax=Streptomyces sp. ISL-87 TaxID=2819188 RepID=UPI001BEB3444|nr:ParB/RepB/Spo0J family partition protein [Streptomyces sp. ISL-87]MBT2611443.1 ParB/RepB/Spo0J family partition protein [Streptomyces sp. ISL-87]
MSGKKDLLGQADTFDRMAHSRSARRGMIDRVTGKDGIPSQLPLNEISANPENPRDELGDLEGLAASLQTVGQVQAITIASVDAYLRDRPQMEGTLDPDAAYVVVDGHRRLEAARLAGLRTMKVFVDDALATTDRRLLEAAFVANAQRKDFTDLEAAQALQLLVDLHGSQHEAARRIGKSQAYVSQKLSLLSLTPKLQADLAAGLRQVNEVRGLANVPASQQQEVADRRAQETAQRKAEKRSVQKTGDNSVITRAVPVPRDPTGDVPATDNSVITAELPKTSASAAADNSVIAPESQQTSASGTADGQRTVHPALTPELWSPVPDLDQLAALLREQLSEDQRLTLATLLVD